MAKYHISKNGATVLVLHSTIDMVVSSSLIKAKAIKAIKESKRNNRMMHHFDFELSDALQN